MTSVLSFTKAEALGNDFIIIGDGDEVPRITAEETVRLCDRRRGIGADGILLIGPSDRASFKMRIFNADGSEAETCGNGLRCAALYAYQRGIATGLEPDIETKAGLAKITMFRRDDGTMGDVKVDLGAPIFTNETVEGYDAVCLSLGNPHAVIFVADLGDTRVDRLGPDIETRPQFPNRTNVEFVQIVNRDKLAVRVWERGAGETQACGTGAAASLAAAAKKGFLERQATVKLAGGDLQVEWGKNTHLYIKGEASLVYEGKIADY